MSTTPKYSRLDPARRRDEILDAANALFPERGYDEVSVEDIASSTGVTLGLVHHYSAAGRTSTSRCSNGSRGPTRPLARRCDAGKGARPSARAT